MRHVLNLIIEPGMGIRIRTRNKKVVDQFPEAEIVPKKAKQLALFVKAERIGKRKRQIPIQRRLTMNGRPNLPHLSQRIYSGC
jgi:hypothetical protein